MSLKSYSLTKKPTSKYIISALSYLSPLFDVNTSKLAKELCISEDKNTLCLKSESNKPVKIYLYEKSEINKELFLKLYPLFLFPVTIDNRLLPSTEQTTWNFYLTSLKYVYINLNKNQYIENEYPIGSLVGQFEFIFEIMFLLILLTEEKASSQEFLSKILPQLSVLWVNGELENTQPWVLSMQIIYFKETLISYFSFLDNPDNPYIWPSEENNKFRILFNIFLTPKIVQQKLIPYEIHQDSLLIEEECELLTEIKLDPQHFINIDIFYPQKNYIYLLQKGDNISIIPALSILTKDSYWFIDKRLNVIIGESGGLKNNFPNPILKIEAFENISNNEKIYGHSFKTFLNIMDQVSNIINNPDNNKLSIALYNGSLVKIMNKYNLPVSILNQIKFDLSCWKNNPNHQAYKFFEEFTKIWRYSLFSNFPYDISYEFLLGSAFCVNYLFERFMYLLPIISFLSAIILPTLFLAYSFQVAFWYKDFLNKYLLGLSIPGGARIYQKLIRPVTFTISSEWVKDVHITAPLSNIFKDTRVAYTIENNELIINYFKAISRYELKKSLSFYSQMTLDEKSKVYISQHQFNMFIQQTREKNKLSVSTIANEESYLDHITTMRVSLFEDIEKQTGHLFAFDVTSSKSLSVIYSSQPKVISLKDIFYKVSRSDMRKKEEIVQLLSHAKDSNVKLCFFSVAESGTGTDWYVTPISNLKNVGNIKKEMRYSFSQAKDMVMDSNLLFGVDDMHFRLNSIASPEVIANGIIYQKLFPFKDKLSKGLIPQRVHEFWANLIMEPEKDIAKAKETKSLLDKRAEELFHEEGSVIVKCITKIIDT